MTLAQRFLAALCLVLAPFAGAVAAPLAYITEGPDGDTVRMLATHAVVASIPMAADSSPWGVVVSRDQARA